MQDLYSKPYFRKKVLVYDVKKRKWVMRKVKRYVRKFVENSWKITLFNGAHFVTDSEQEWLTVDGPMSIKKAYELSPWKKKRQIYCKVLPEVIYWERGLEFTCPVAKITKQPLDELFGIWFCTRDEVYYEAEGFFIRGMRGKKATRRVVLEEGIVKTKEGIAGAEKSLQQTGKKS